jgi:phosphate transport system ATP-binding protein
MDTHIQVRHLNVVYGKNTALKDISLEIPRGQITAVIGPSGCGKTTLLKSFNRFLELIDGINISGEILLDGENIYSPGVDVTEIRKKVGLLAQTPYPLPMSIYDNVAYGLKIHDIQSKPDRDAAVQHYLEISGLWNEVKDRLHTPASELSVGQQQRLCLARGLAVEPEILLGDELTSALDPISARHIEQRLIDLKHTYTMVLVTHMLRQAKRLADYVVFLYMGELIECGQAHEVFEHPVQSLTRSYLSGEF